MTGKEKSMAGISRERLDEEFERLRNEHTPPASAAKSMSPEEVNNKMWIVVGAKLLRDRLSVPNRRDGDGDED